MKFYFKVLPDFINSRVEVWEENTPSSRKNITVMNLQITCPIELCRAVNTDKLISQIRLHFSLDSGTEISVEEVTS